MLHTEEKIRQHEVLTAVWMDGAWHAIYPTATTTLCLQRCTARGTTEAFPTCETCARVAVRMHEIDKSCPASWKSQIEEIQDERRTR